MGPAAPISFATWNGCEFLREGDSHTVYVNRQAKRVSTIPRHNDINEDLARKICKDLQVPRLTTSRS